MDWIQLAKAVFCCWDMNSYGQV